MTKKPSHKSFKKEAPKIPTIREEYEKLKLIEIAEKLANLYVDLKYWRAEMAYFQRQILAITEREILLENLMSNDGQLIADTCSYLVNNTLEDAEA